VRSFLETPALEVVGKMSGGESRESLIGRRLGSYECVSLLGKGGMGEVYRARDTQLHRDVALKLLPSVFALPRCATPTPDHFKLILRYNTL